MISKPLKIAKLLNIFAKMAIFRQIWSHWKGKLWSMEVSLELWMKQKKLIFQELTGE